MLRATQEQEWWADQVVHVMLEGKRALDAAMLDVGRLVAETLMYMEREERSGPDYHPTSSGLRKWASQRGSIYVWEQAFGAAPPRSLSRVFMRRVLGCFRHQVLLRRV